MGQYYTVNDDISELLDYLQLYREIIQQGLVDEYYLKHIDALVKEIDTLEEMAEKGEDVSSYDFGSLNKKLGAVFHPDRCHIDFNSLGYPMDMYGKATGIVQELAKQQREGAFSSFKYNSAATQSSERQKGSSTPYTQGNPSSSRNTYQRNARNSSSNEYYDYSDFNTSYTITDFLKDRFNAIFAGIPSCQEDYDKINERLKKSIDSVRLRLSAIEQRISLLEQKKNFNKVEWYNAMRDEIVDGIYNERYSSLHKSFLDHQDMQRKAERNRGMRYNQLTPQIQMQYQRWQADARAFYDKYQRLLYDYNQRMCSFEPMDEEAMHQQILKARQYYLDHYYDREKAFNGIMQQVLNNDPTYCNLAKASEMATMQFQQTDARFRDYVANRGKYRAEIKEKINSDYQKKNASFETELRKAYTRKGRVSRKLSELEAKHAEFVQQYGSSYGETVSGNKSR